MSRLIRAWLWAHAYYVFVRLEETATMLSDWAFNRLMRIEHKLTFESEEKLDLDDEDINDLPYLVDQTEDYFAQDAGRQLTLDNGVQTKGGWRPYDSYRG